VQLLSLSVPIIGIQANMLEVSGVRGLHFNKVIDSYEEPEEVETQPYDENYWIKNYAGSLECARWYRALLEKLYGEVPAKYFEWYISFSIGGVARVWVNRRKNNRATISVKVGKEKLQETTDYLNGKGIPFTTQAWGSANFNVDLQQLKDNAEAHEWLASRLSPETLKVKAR